MTITSAILCAIGIASLIAAALFAIYARQELVRAAEVYRQAAELRQPEPAAWL